MKGSSPVFGRAAQAKARPKSDADLLSRLMPAEGWLALFALLLMCVIVAVAIDDATWAGYVMGTTEKQTSFLFLGAILSVLIGLGLAKSKLSIVRAHAIGAAAGAAYLVVAISGVISSAESLTARISEMSASVNLFAWEVFVLQERSSETSVFLLTIGALLWTTGQFAAFSVFRRQRALPAIVAALIPLMINVSLTVRGQYLHIVIFAAGALLLLVRLNLLEQVRGWQERMIGESSQVSNAFMRAGAAFVGLALVGSITLAANTSSAPLGNAWRNLDEQLLQVGFEVNRVIGGVTGEARGPSVLFGPTQTIRELWESSEAIEFTALSTDPSPDGHRWRGAVYASFNGRTWSHGARETYLVEASQDVLAPSGESVADDPTRQRILLEITPQEIIGPVFLAPDGPVQLSQLAEMQVQRDEDGSLGGFVRGQLPGGIQTGVPYSVIAAVRVNEGEHALTQSKLAVAGVDYPGWVARYTEIREGSIGPIVYELTNQLVDELPAEQRNPYHISKAIETWLHKTGGFDYRLDVRGQCVGRNFIDCFLEMKQGYCEYFASTMVMMLRTQGIPARYAVGYLPGRLRADGTWEVPRSAAHAWVEVYFPEYGWVTFDPTPGNEENLNQPSNLPVGEPVPTPTSPQVPIPSPFMNPDEGRPEPDVLPGAGGSAGGGDGGTTLIGVLLIGALAMTVLLLFALALLRRLPRTEPELAYRSVTRMASRFGHGPRPTQTVYEFTDSLGELVPAVRAELREVATAKVETSYGRRSLPADALESLRRAYARLRIGLLRLLWRRRPRSRGPRNID